MYESCRTYESIGTEVRRVEVTQGTAGSAVERGLGAFPCHQRTGAQKSPIFPQKICCRTRAAVVSLSSTHKCAQAPYASTKEPSTSAKDPYISAKKPCISENEPYISAKRRASNYDKKNLTTTKISPPTRRCARIHCGFTRLSISPGGCPYRRLRI